VAQFALDPDTKPSIDPRPPPQWKRASPITFGIWTKLSVCYSPRSGDAQCLELREFHNQIFAVISAIQDSLESYSPTQAMRAPADWPKLRSIVRTVAEDLMLFSNVNTAISKLREDQATLLAVLWLTSELKIQDLILAERRAYESAPDDMSLLPFYPFCSYLIELCNGLELGPRTS